MAFRNLDTDVIRLAPGRTARLTVVPSLPRFTCTPRVLFSRRVSDARMPDGRQLWDLESWDVTQDWAAPRPLNVPVNASKDYGYVDSDGAAHVVFRRVVRREGDV